MATLLVHFLYHQDGAGQGQEHVGQCHHYGQVGHVYAHAGNKTRVQAKAETGHSRLERPKSSPVAQQMVLIFFLITSE
jgi:hypothetical protein